MRIDPDIIKYLDERGVTRLVHFTKASNLPRILADGELRDVVSLQGEMFKGFAASDSVRADGHTDKISLSIEYPNVFYHNAVRQRTIGYPDWVFILVHPRVAAREGSLFSPCNAAKYGAPLVAGLQGLEACYAPEVRFGRRFVRSATHAPQSPTDVQAEVLVPGPISLADITGLVVESHDRVEHERDRLAFLGVDPDQVEWLVSPNMSDSTFITQAVQHGKTVEIFNVDGSRHE